ncbi:MAG: hypothetical protein WCF14_11765, partial [Nitrososphaeraceae archaeon]
EERYAPHMPDFKPCAATGLYVNARPGTTKRINARIISIFTSEMKKAILLPHVTILSLLSVVREI